MSKPKEYRNTVTTVQLRSEGNGSIYFGTPIVYNATSETLGYFRERILPGAFDDWLKDSPDIYACVNHDARQLLGRTSAGTLRIIPAENGINIEGDLPNTSYAADLRELVNRKDIRGMSFQFVAVDDMWGHEDGKMMRTVKRAELYEVCFVTDPAYQQTEAGIRSMEAVLASIPKPPPIQREHHKRMLDILALRTDIQQRKR